MTQRRNYIIEGKMQGKFTLTLLMLIFLISVISFCNLYVIGSFVITHYTNLEEANTPGEFIYTAMQVIWPRLILIIVVNIIIVVIIGVFYSHQFAGPSFKMERSLREIAAGDLSSKIYLRKSDSMHNVADAINQLIDNLRSVIRKTQELSIQTKENLAKIEIEDEEVQRRIGTLKGISDEIHDLFDRFTLEERPEPKESSSSKEEEDGDSSKEAE